MATPILLPKQGNTVESCIILKWHKAVGETIDVGDPLCEVETDKTALEIESTESGTLLNRFFEVGDEVPVMTVIAAVGEPGEDGSHLAPNGTNTTDPPTYRSTDTLTHRPTDPPHTDPRTPISPRALQLAIRKAVEWQGIRGTGPRGRIIERDIEAVLAARPKITPVAQRMLKSGDFQPPAQPTPNRLTAQQLIPTALPLRRPTDLPAHRPTAHRPPRTLFTWADAKTLTAFQERVAASDPNFGLNQIELIDLIHFAVVQTISHRFPALNLGQKRVALGFAVEVDNISLDPEPQERRPVIQAAEQLSLQEMATTRDKLSRAARQHTLATAAEQGSTVSISHLPQVERFTPQIWPGHAAALGIGGVALKPIQIDSRVEFVPHLPISLSVPPQTIPNSYAARFLEGLANHLKHIDLIVLKPFN